MRGDNRRVILCLFILEVMGIHYAIETKDN